MRKYWYTVPSSQVSKLSSESSKIPGYSTQGLIIKAKLRLSNVWEQELRRGGRYGTSAGGQALQKNWVRTTVELDVTGHSWRDHGGVYRVETGREPRIEPWGTERLVLPGQAQESNKLKLYDESELKTCQRFHELETCQGFQRKPLRFIYRCVSVSSCLWLPEAADVKVSGSVWDATPCSTSPHGWLTYFCWARGSKLDLFPDVTRILFLFLLCN